MHPANLTCRRSKIIPSHKSNSLSNHPANERCFAFCEAAGTWRVQAQELRNGTRDGLPMLGQWGSQTCSRASDIVDYLGCALQTLLPHFSARLQPGSLMSLAKLEGTNERMLLLLDYSAKSKAGAVSIKS